MLRADPLNDLDKIRPFCILGQNAPANKARNWPCSISHAERKRYWPKFFVTFRKYSCPYLGRRIYLGLTPKVTKEMKHANGNMPDVLIQQAADSKPSGICGPLQALPSARFRSNSDHAGSSHADWAAVAGLSVVLAMRRDVEHGGENWLLPLVGRLDGFPFYDILTNQKPDAVDGNSALYAAAKNPEIDVPKVIHFAMGMFWKASVHSWSGNRVQALINLGKYGEDVRKFLRGEAKFPAHMALTVGVTPPPITPTFTMPYRGSATDYHNFLFHIPGINFALAVGNQVGEEMRSACFATHPLHPILLKNLAEMNLNVSKEVAAGARKAQSVLTYVKESKHLQEYLKARGKEMMRGRDAARKMPDVSREE
jgi:hypothetical protein